MLCRAVLAIAAVSCTFQPNALANAQGTELVQLKDLVCVLWFSGLKKEDMDVNLLRKLRRHNINIDDMRNETMLQECTANKLATTSEKPVYKMKITATLSTTNDPSQLAKAESNQYFDTIAKIISDNQKSINRKYSWDPPNLPNMENLQTNVFEPIYSKPNVPFERSLPLERSSTDKVELVQENEDSKITNILKFWQKVSKSNKPKKIGRSSSTGSIIPPKYKKQMRLLNSITSPPFYSDTTQSNPDMAKWVAEFISKNMDRFSTTTTQRNVPNDLGEVFLPFYRDLIKTYNSRQSIEDMVDSQVREEIFNRITSTTEEPNPLERKTVPNTVFKSIDDILKINDRFDNPFKLYSKKAIAGDVVPKDKIDIYCDHLNKRRIMRNNIAVNEDENENQMIQKKTIQEIADSIKAIVLKDLGHLINGTTTPASTQVSLPALVPTILAATTKLTPTLAPIATTTVKPQNQTDNNANHVMDKIIDLYERVKAISEKVDISKDNNKHLNENHEYNISSKQNVPTETLQQHAFNRMTNVKNILMNPFRDLTRQEILKLPSIIQTNSGEIAPLVLPVAHPMKIVNQIVMLTTEVPIKKLQINEKPKSRFEAIMEALNNNQVHTSSETRTSQKHFIPNLSDHERHSHSEYSDINHSYKEIPRKHDYSNGDIYERLHNFRAQYKERANDKLRNHHNVENRESTNYFDHISSGHSDNVPLYRHNEKFHERLEKGEGRWGGNKHSLSSRVRDHNRHVSPRHQQPLNVRHSPYDDTHFRNFLKTQQKVNDMLEKILGTKNTMISVETT